MILKALNVPITESLALQYLPKMSLDSTIKLLQFLHLALRVEAECDNLILWLSMAINSHYSNLIMSKREDVMELINELALTVAEFEKGSSFCGLLAPFIKMVMEGKCQTDANNHNQDYCIEVVNF